MFLFLTSVISDSYLPYLWLFDFVPLLYTYNPIHFRKMTWPQKNSEGFIIFPPLPTDQGGWCHDKLILSILDIKTFFIKAMYICNEL